jgi:hypothetical protein
MSSSLAYTAAITLGVTLLVSGIGKLHRPETFVAAVIEYEMLPETVATIYGRLVPPIEVLCGLALLVGIAPVPTGLLTFGLLLGFSVGVLINLARGRKLDCHCFGPQSNDPLTWVSLVRIFVLLTCATAVVAWRGTELIAPPPSDYLPAVSTAFGVLLVLYLTRMVPAQWQMWHIGTAPGIKPTGGRISLRQQPLTANIERLERARCAHNQ